MMIGVASNVPGSLGVIEAAMLIGLPQFHRGELSAALLTFRLMYFVLPLLLAACLLGLHEFRAAIAGFVGYSSRAFLPRTTQRAFTSDQPIGKLVDVADRFLQFSERAPSRERKGLALLEPGVGELGQAGRNCGGLLVEIVSEAADRLLGGLADLAIAFLLAREILRPSVRSNAVARGSQ